MPPAPALTAAIVGAHAWCGRCGPQVAASGGSCRLNDPKALLPRQPTFDCHNCSVLLEQRLQVAGSRPHLQCSLFQTSDSAESPAFATGQSGDGETQTDFYIQSCCGVCGDEFQDWPCGMHGQRPTCAVCQLGPLWNHDLLRFDFQSIVVNVQNQLQFWTSLRYARICLCAVSKRNCICVSCVSCVFD